MDPNARLPAKEVGDELAKQYYLVLQTRPKLLRLFYKGFSKIGRPGNNGKMCSYTLSDTDDDNLNMLSSGGFDSAEVTSIISQDSQDGSVLVVVGGYFTCKNRPERNFTQVFLLAPQVNGYFVLNDMLHFDDTSVLPANNETKVVRKEVADASLIVEDGSKIPDASVVMKPIPKADAVDDTGNGNNRESHAFTECSTVHVKNLPANDASAKVANALNKFGPIKRGGIEIRNTTWNYHYGFVEFEEAIAAERAIKASPLRIDGKKVAVQMKRGSREQMRIIEEEGRHRGKGVYDFRGWRESMEGQSKAQEEEGRTGVDHAWDCEQVNEEHRKFQEEQMKLEEENGEEENQH
ncbi:unnamed protein product [Thlaspi arvense]|uniref:Uncharacterized protein n=1 Tax=Thlaspi arvense TaxID=13288 RepID=A0AAU9S0D5_THLAR|nr:unnamed protein product [Thlaspi arvense]